MWGGGGRRGRLQRNGGKSDRGEKRGTVLILWPLSQTSPPPPPSPSSLSIPPLLPSLSSHPLFLALPTSSPGNKDFHSCARGDPQQGREGGRESERERKGRGEDRGRGGGAGGVKVGRFEDHGDRARRPGIACCFFVRSASADGSPPSDLVASRAPQSERACRWERRQVGHRPNISTGGLRL